MLDGRLVDVQYSNWQSLYPNASRPSNEICVVVTQNNEWRQTNCSARQKYVCQS